MADAIWALLTPPGKGAIATISVAGPDVWETLAPLFESRSVFDRRAAGFIPAGQVAAIGSSLLDGDQPRRTSTVLVGRFGEPGQPADDVVVFVRSPDHVEIHSHGGPAVVRLIGDALEGRGVRRATGHEWLTRHEGADRAEAIEILSRCPTTRTAAIVLDYLAGAFDRAVAEGRIERLRQLVPVAEHLDRPWRVVIAGAPNVGKSSLVNALAGFARSLVSATAGTTRDVVTTRIALDGWPIELCDTAGQRDADDAIESAGIELARDASARADCLIWVLDSSAPPVMPDRPALVVVNKIDMPPAWDSADTGLLVSARTGQGLPELTRAIVDRLIPRPPDSGEGVPVTCASRQTLCI